MSKNKTKIARREVKRAAQKKAANFAKASKPTGVTKSTPSKPAAKSGTNKAHGLQEAAGVKGKGSEESKVQASQKKEIPFGVYDNVLLVGEGDFSFTKSLAIEHGCAGVVGTSYDSEEAVREKYVPSLHHLIPCGTVQ